MGKFKRTSCYESSLREKSYCAGSGENMRERALHLWYLPKVLTPLLQNLHPARWLEMIRKDEAGADWWGGEGNIFTIWATHSLTHSVPLTLVQIPRWLHSQVKEELVNTSIYFFIVFSNVRTPPVFSAYSLKTCLVNTNMPRPGPKLAIVFFLTFPFSTVKLVQAESGGGYQGYPNDPSYSSNPFSSSYPAPSSYPSYPFYAGYPSYPGYVGVAPGDTSLPTYPVAYDKRQVTISHL